MLKLRLPTWRSTLAIRLLLLAVGVDVLVGTGAFLYRWGTSLFTTVLGAASGPQALATAVLCKSALLAPAWRRRMWAAPGLAAAYLLSQPLFLVMAGLLHLDPLVSPVLYRQSQAAALLAAGLLLLSWSEARQIESPLRRRMLRGIVALGLAAALVAQIAFVTGVSSDFFLAAMLLWSLIPSAAIVALPIGLLVFWWRRRRARLRERPQVRSAEDPG
jgi:hypothetical protein